MLDHLAGGHEPAVDDETFVAVLRAAVETVRAVGVPFVLMGGIGSATHGRDRWTHDIDLFLRPEDAGRALEALGAAGFETEETHWDWLFKAERSGVVVDLIFRSTGGIVVDEELIERAREHDFRGVVAPVIPPEDLLVIKAVVHDEHMPRHWHDGLGLVARCDLDWDYLLRRARTYGARRVLSLLVYAQSNDLIVPNRVIEQLFDDIYRS